MFVEVVLLVIEPHISGKGEMWLMKKNQLMIYFHTLSGGKS